MTLNFEQNDKNNYNLQDYNKFLLCCDSILEKSPEKYKQDEFVCSIKTLIETTKNINSNRPKILLNKKWISLDKLIKKYLPIYQKNINDKTGEEWLKIISSMLRQNFEAKSLNTIKSFSSKRRMELKILTRSHDFSCESPDKFLTENGDYCWSKVVENL